VLVDRGHDVGPQHPHRQGDDRKREGAPVQTGKPVLACQLGRRSSATWTGSVRDPIPLVSISRTSISS
jgi:hypothetical protein